MLPQSCHEALPKPLESIQGKRMPAKDIEHMIYIVILATQNKAHLSRKTEHGLFNYQLLGEFNTILKTWEVSEINSYLQLSHKNSITVNHSFSSAKHLL